jgi:carbon monoxide dehydrogenase subunit G
MTVEESVVVARPPAEVYDFVADLERAPEWQSSLESVDVERGVEVRTFAGHRREASFDVTQHERPTRYGVESRSGPVRARAVFAFTPVDEGTQVDFRLDVEVGGAARLAAAMMRGRLAREARQNLARLSELLEA